MILDLEDFPKLDWFQELSTQNKNMNKKNLWKGKNYIFEHMKHVVTIITTFDEDQRLLKQSIDSILSQQGVKVTLLVATVEDDRNLDWLSSIEGITPVIVSRDEHPGYSPEGSFFQLNVALKCLEGWKFDYFSFFSGNDEMLPGYLATMANALDSSGRLIAYSDILKVMPNGEEKIVKTGTYNPVKHRESNFVPDVALVSKELYELLPLRADQWGNLAYWDFWLRAGRKYDDAFEYVPIPGWKYKVTVRSMHIQRGMNKQKLESYKLQRDAFKASHV